MKKIICLALCFVFLFATLVSCGANGDKPKETEPKETEPVIDSYKDDVTDEVTNYVLISVKDYGEIVVELYPDVAPITVENFKNLVSENFYDGLIFHRIIYGFMIQGGAFTEDYQYRNSPNIKGEFAVNGVQNDLSHTRGVISMARAEAYDSASSQFFIMHLDTPDLDSKYAAFGKVVEGIEVVDKIAAVSTDYYDMPLKNVVIESVRFINYTK